MYLKLKLKLKLKLAPGPSTCRQAGSDGQQALTFWVDLSIYLLRTCPRTDDHPTSRAL
jgi:hypothetical protein